MLVVEDIRDYVRDILENYVLTNNISNNEAAKNLRISKSTFSRLWNKKQRISETEFKKYFSMCEESTKDLIFINAIGINVQLPNNAALKALDKEYNKQGWELAVIKKS